MCGVLERMAFSAPESCIVAVLFDRAGCRTGSVFDETET